MKKNLPLLLAIIIIFLGCTQKNTENNTDTIKNYQLSDTLMTVEKYADMDFELATMLMEKYYDKFKDKKYEDVKEIYANFLIEKDFIYKKYGITDAKKNSVWSKKNKAELKDYRKAHPEINYFKKFSNFKEANIAIYKLAKDKYHSNKPK